MAQAGASKGDSVPVWGWDQEVSVDVLKSLGWRILDHLKKPAKHVPRLAASALRSR